MKKGILTFHNCANYGAAFQAYALWKTLSRLTEDQVELIDYTNYKISTLEQIKRMRNESTLLRRLKNLIAIPYIEKKWDLFRSFIKSYSNLSTVSYTSENIKKCVEEYDTIFFGSDQIWNMELTGNDLNYYGSFSSHIRKVAYAASLGKYDVRKHVRELDLLLNQFDSIATREKRDQEELLDAFGVHADHVLDPTLLISSADWSELAKPIQVPERYILLYLISPQKSDFSFAKQLGKKLKLPVLYITYSWKNYPGVRNLKDVSPEQFIYLLKNAELMVTNSFHGTVLAINLQKNFYWQNHARAGRANARVLEILDELKLNDRIVTNNITKADYKINDWSVAVKNLAEARSKSINYLIENIV